MQLICGNTDIEMLKTQSGMPAQWLKYTEDHVLFTSEEMTEGVGT